jgi:hypothetical protein
MTKIWAYILKHTQSINTQDGPVRIEMILLMLKINSIILYIFKLPRVET